MTDFRFHANKKKIKHLLVFFLGCIVYTPVVFSQAYFQQDVAYEIDATLNDSLHELIANEKVYYTNNSPDTLKFIYFHLWPNAYSSNKTELAKQIFQHKGKEKLFNDPELRGYIDSLNFKVNDQAVQWDYLVNQKDICKILLNTPLLPGVKIIISTPFHVKIPKGVTSRLGHINQSYQISQWYPKPAVYDTSGWHPMSYLDQGEFYSEFGTFDVSITLPENYSVGASGELQNVIELARLDSLANDSTWKNITMLGKAKSIAKTSKIKTLRYIGSNMHDFAWFADKQFNVMKGKVTLPESGREVITWVMCTHRQSMLWKKSLEYTNQAILKFSNMIGDYPYSSFTVVQSALSAGLGMEYPGITVIGTTKNAFTLDEVISHEIGHSWFYGALGSNERRYPFMDESITSNYTERYMADKYPQKKMWEDVLKRKKQAKFFHADKISTQQMMELAWLIPARNNEEQPINIGSANYEPSNYSQMIYNKGSKGFGYLRAYLGNSLYDSIMHTYYRKWKFHHPQPEDLRQTFEVSTDKYLNWFFDDFIGTTKRLDYKIVRLESHRVLLKNNGELISPIIIAGIQNDSVCFEKWIDGFSGQKWINIPPGSYSKLKIDPNFIMPELYRNNNTIRTSGIFPTLDSFQPQFLFGIENPEKHSIMYIPAINWNHENGFMMGMAFYNGLLVPKPLEYIVIPFYTFSNSTLAGYGKITYNFTPFNTVIQLAKVSVEGTRFGSPANRNYQKLSTSIDVKFRPKIVMNPYRQSIYARYILASDLAQIKNAVDAKMNPYFQLGYNYENTSLVNPYHLLVSFESGTAFQKVALDFNYKKSYVGKNNGLDARFFAGVMLNNTSADNYYSLAPSGRSGNDIYMYQGIFPNRFGVFPTSFLSRQMALTEGGLVTPVNEQLGYSKWIISVSLSSTLPGKLSHFGIKPFVNLLINDKGISTYNNSLFFGEAGLKFGIGNFFEIYVPLLVTPNIQFIAGSIQNRIRFVLNLNFSHREKIIR